MLATPLDAWLNIYDHRPHPMHGFYSNLTHRQLWRLHAVRRGHVPDVDLDPTDPDSWETSVAAAEFIGITTHQLAAHLKFAAAANPGTPMHTPAPGSPANDWHARRTQMWEALRSSP